MGVFAVLLTLAVVARAQTAARPTGVNSFFAAAHVFVGEADAICAGNATCVGLADAAAAEVTDAEKSYEAGTLTDGEAAAFHAAFGKTIVAIRVEVLKEHGLPASGSVPPAVASGRRRSRSARTSSLANARSAPWWPTKRLRFAWLTRS